jgi:hypothetical protein
MKQQTFEAGVGIYRVEAAVLICGRDISIAICGGDTPHIGAVALASPRMSLADKEKTSASASVICVTGHKEDELARSAALKLASRFSCQTVVVAGIHIDDATEADIKVLWKNYEAVMEKIIDGLGSLMEE